MQLKEARVVTKCLTCAGVLNFNSSFGHYRCQDCGGEWWPGDPAYGLASVWDDEQKYKKSISKPGGKSRSGKEREKKKNHNKLPSERYRIE